MAFIGGISAGRCSLLVAKENQKGRRCPQGMKAPAGLLSRRPVCEANAACSAQQGHGDFDALDPTGCGTLRLLRALGGTRILQAAAPTAPPCIRRWRRSSPLQTRGCTPLSTPKKKSKRKNASRFAQTGCGTLRLLRALGGTRILQAAAPTAPPCIRRRRRSSLLHIFFASPIWSRCATDGTVKYILYLLRDSRRLTAADTAARSAPLRGAVAQRLRGLLMAEHKKA